MLQLLILHESDSELHFLMEIDMGGGISFDPVPLRGLYDKAAKELTLFYNEKVVHTARIAKESLGEHLANNKKKIVAAVGSAGLAAALASPSVPIHTNSGYEIAGARINTAILNASGDSGAYKGTIAMKALNSALAESLDFHKKTISKGHLAKGGDVADEVSIIVSIGDQQRISPDSIKKINSLIQNDELRKSTIDGLQEKAKKGVFYAHASSLPSLKEFVHDKKRTVLLHIPSQLMDSAMNSPKEAKALSSLVSSTMSHELTHAVYGKGETEAVQAQVQMGKKIDPGTQIAALLAANDASNSQRVYKNVSGLFNWDRVSPNLLAHAGDADTKEMKRISDILSDKFKKEAALSVLTSRDAVERFSSVYSSDRIRAAEKYGPLPFEYAGAINPNINYSKSVLSGNDGQSMPIGFMSTAVKTLKENGISDKNIKTYMSAMVKSGELFRYHNLSDKNTFYNDDIEAALGVGIRHVVDSSIPEVVDSLIQKENSLSHQNSRHNDRMLASTADKAPDVSISMKR